MRTVLTMALALVLAAPASADKEDLWNPMKILNEGRDVFVMLCTEHGTLKMPTKEVLHCITSNPDAAEVLVEYKDGSQTATTYTMVWNYLEGALPVLKAMQKEFGDEHGKAKSNGCVWFWWDEPKGEHKWTVSFCEERGTSNMGIVW